MSIALSLVVTAAPTLTISQNNVQFYYQTGQANPAQTVINLASTSTPLGYSVTSATTSGGAGWLVVGQTGGTTPSSLTIGANPAGLAPGVYNGTVTVATAGSSAPAQVINVSLTVAANPLAIPSPNMVGFTYQLGGALTAAQTVAVTSTMPGTPLNFAAGFTPAAGSPNFLTIAQSGPATPATLTLTANTAGLTPGTYSGQLSIVTAGNSAVTVPVTLTVGNNPLLTFSQPAANFNFQIGTAPPVAQIINVGSTGAPLNFTAASTTSGGTFLAVSSGGATPGTTPGTLTITANPAGLAVGAYTGSVTVTPAGSTPQTIPITLTVSNTPLVNITPAALTFTASVVGGTPPGFQTLALTSTGDPIPFTATAAGGSFLVVTPASGNAPANLSVGVNPNGLAAGTYAGTITVIAGGQTQTVPVTLVVNSGINVAVNPATLAFMQVAGGAAPAPQTINVTSTNGSVPISAVVTTGGGFLTVTSTAATPGTVTVAANAGMLAAGTYMGSIVVTGTGAANGPQVVLVTLTVTAPTPVPTLTATPTPINVSAVAGGPNPANTSIAIAASGGAAVPFTVTAAAASGGTWLTATPATGTTPGTVTVAINTMGLAAGTYTGTVTIAAGTGAPAGVAAITIPVNLTVTTPVIPTPSVTIVQNAASAISGAVAPGEIVSIFGTNIGPATAVLLQLTSTGAVATTLGNTQVTFDGIPAPLTYVSATQINAVVPYEIAGRVSTHVVVTVSAKPSTGTDLRVVDSAPGIFTTNAMGSGPGAILNQDYNPNTPGTPAAVGTVIQIFATGEGQDSPAGITGSVSTSQLKKSILPVSVTIGGQAAQVTYAGSAPGLVAGVLQVNAIVPAGVQASPANVAITVGSGMNAPQSQANVTVNVQTSAPAPQ
ncbi:MAG: BACON domain-containing protein [Bryobacteraceae bacterium]